MTALREAVARAIEDAPTLSFSYDQESGTFCAMAFTPEGEHVTIGSYLTQALAVAAARKWMCLALADAALSAVAPHIAERVDAEREACAKVAESKVTIRRDNKSEGWHHVEHRFPYWDEIAAAIRARAKESNDG